MKNILLFIFSLKMGLVLAQTKQPVYQDKPFWVFLMVSFVTALIFFQLFTTLPLYHNEQYGLTEFQTGLLMTLNGLLIFALEMPTVGFMERKAFPKIRIIIIGSFVMAFSFILLIKKRHLVHPLFTVSVNAI